MGTRGTPPFLTPMTDGIDADAWGQPARLLLVSYMGTIKQAQKPGPIRSAGPSESTTHSLNITLSTHKHTYMDSTREAQRDTPIGLAPKLI